MRGTFANVRLRNLLAPDTQGGFYWPSCPRASRRRFSRRRRSTPMRACRSACWRERSRFVCDWAAKGPRLLGVRFAIAESYERIHRSNSTAACCRFSRRTAVGRVARPDRPGAVRPRAARGRCPLAEGNGDARLGQPDRVRVPVRIDTPKEWLYYRHGGILHFVLRQLLQA